MFNLVEKLTCERNIIRRNYICPTRNTLDVTVICIGNTAEKVNYSYRCVIRASLKVENNNSLFIEHICDRAYVFISVKLFENDVSL